MGDERKPLEMWTVYDHPRDFPNEFVARKFLVDASGPHPTDEIMTSPWLYPIREALIVRGLVCLDRNELDFSEIIETWL